MSPLQSTVLTTTSAINTSEMLSNEISTHIPSQIHHVKKIKINKFAELPILTSTIKNHAEEDAPAATSNQIQESNYIGI